MSDLTIDPQLRLQPPTQPSREPGLSRAGDTPDAAQSDGDQNDGGTSRKRQKLNLYKCNQCRVARKKVMFTPPDLSCCADGRSVFQQIALGLTNVNDVNNTSPSWNAQSRS
jgi:hypothetical protein